MKHPFLISLLFISYLCYAFSHECVHEKLSHLGPVPTIADFLEESLGPLGESQSNFFFKCF